MPTASWIGTLNARNNPDVFITLLTFSHTTLTETIYVSSDPKQDLPIKGVKGVVSGGNEFVFIPFQIVLPTLQADTLPTAKCSVDNVSEEILAALQGLSTPPDVMCHIVLASDPDNVQYRVEGLKLANVGYNEITLDGEFSSEYYLQERYPSVRFTPSRFPGVFRGRSVNQSA